MSDLFTIPMCSICSEPLDTEKSATCSECGDEICLGCVDTDRTDAVVCTVCSDDAEEDA